MVAKLEFQGSEQINAPRSTVFGKLKDPNVLARSIPDASDVMVSDNGEINCRVRVKVSVVESTMRVTMKVVEATPDSLIVVRSMASGAGSRAEVDATFRLSGDSTTTVDWTATANLSGLMAGLGTSILKGYASRMIGNIVDKMKEMIQSGG